MLEDETIEISHSGTKMKFVEKFEALKCALKFAWLCDLRSVTCLLLRELARSPLLALERSADLYVCAPYKPSLIEVAFLIAIRLEIAWYSWLSKSTWLEVVEKISQVIELKTSSNYLHTQSVSKHSMVSDRIPFLLAALMQCLEKKKKCI